MKATKHLGWLAGGVAACFLFLLSTRPALGQSGPPPVPTIWLDSYSFYQTNFDSDDGYAPIGYTNVFSIADWGGNALWLETSNEIPAYIH
jgi:hypothetical protein